MGLIIFPIFNNEPDSVQSMKHSNSDMFSDSPVPKQSLLTLSDNNNYNDNYIPGY